MIVAQTPKFVPLINAQLLVDDAYFAGSHQHGSINTAADGLGFHYASIYFQLGATDIAVAELSLYESDDDSTYTQITTPVTTNYATSPNTLPSATADGTCVAWFIDLRNRKRYIRVNAKGGNGSVGAYAYSFALLWNADETPSTVTKRGLAQQIIG